MQDSALELANSIERKTIDKSRAVVFTLSGVAVVVLIAVLWSTGLARLGLAAHRTYDVRLSIPAMIEEGNEHHGFPIETWFIYDRQGREVGEVYGGDEQQFRRGLKAILQAPEPVGSTRTLPWELSRMVDKSDHLLGPFPQTDFTIIKYWEKKCEDCLLHHRNAVDVLQKLLSTFGSLSVNVVYVDVDIESRLGLQRSTPD